MQQTLIAIEPIAFQSLTPFSPFRLDIIFGQTFTAFGTASAPNRAAFVDFDGDRKTDISIFRPSSGQWWYSRSSDAQVRALQFGLGTDKIVPADFSGDGKTDIAVRRETTGE